VVNDASASARVDALAGAVLGQPGQPDDRPDPRFGGLRYVLNKVPGALAFLGGCPPHLDPDSAPPNHSNRVQFDESAMSDGVAVYAAMALDALR